MRKIRYIAILLAIMVMVSLVAVGCGPKSGQEDSTQAEDQSSAQEEIVSVGEEADETEGEIPEQTAIELEEAPLEDVSESEGQITDGVSVTTGQPGVSTYRPVMVQLDNSDFARKWQTGLNMADVVYETANETNDADTRLTALFNDAMFQDGAPEKLTVGAVRSVRYYHQWIVSEWDALLVHQGGPDSTGNPESEIWKGESSQPIKQRISAAGLYPQNSNLLFVNDEGDPLKNCAMTDVVADAEIYDYEPTPRTPFHFDAEETYADEKEIEKIELAFSGKGKQNWVEYRYTPDTNKLTRYMSGEEIIDQADDKPVEVQNLIVQYVNYGPMPGDPPRAKLDVFGSGKADFIIQGKHMTGTWERKTIGAATIYKLDNGEEVTLTPGNTWIAVHPNSTSVSISYADGESYSNEQQQERTIIEQDQPIEQDQQAEEQTTEEPAE